MKTFSILPFNNKKSIAIYFIYNKSEKICLLLLHLFFLGVCFIKFLTTITMKPTELISKEERKKEMLMEIVSDFSDDREFLEKLNKLTFGFLKNNNIR